MMTKLCCCVSLCCQMSGKVPPGAPAGPGLYSHGKYRHCDPDPSVVDTGRREDMGTAAGAGRGEGAGTAAGAGRGEGAGTATCAGREEGAGTAACAGREDGAGTAACAGSPSNARRIVSSGSPISSEDTGTAAGAGQAGEPYASDGPIMIATAMHDPKPLRRLSFFDKMGILAGSPPIRDTQPLHGGKKMPV
jgi:hypothetical protein